MLETEMLAWGRWLERCKEHRLTDLYKDLRWMLKSVEISEIVI